MSGVREHLLRRFEDQSVVIWHDQAEEYATEVQGMDLPAVETHVVDNDEFNIKVRIRDAEPGEKFLVYRSGEVPSGIDNWLADLELTYGVFTADRAALVAHDLGLTVDGLDHVVAAHESFFKAARRVEALKVLLATDDDLTKVRAKMCAVLLGQKEHSLLDLTRTLLIENAEGRSPRFDQIVEYGLDAFLWKGFAQIYGYQRNEPTITDFVLWVFKKAEAGFSDGRADRNIHIDFDAMRYDVRSRKALASLAARAADDIDYASGIEGLHFTELLDRDIFPQVEQKILSDLARGVTLQQVGRREVIDTIRRRRESVWYDDYALLYDAIGSAAELLADLSTLNLTLTSFDEGLDRYRSDWFRIDQLYRQFNHALRTGEYPKPLEDLRERVEAQYTNSFLFPLGTTWQQQVDGVSEWRSSTLRPQSSFYADHVAPLVRGGEKKAVVIISDAMRYEIAETLASRLRQEDKLEAEIDAMLGVLPSYTQLGMASLLPHQKLAHSSDGKTVLVDGQPSNGTENRAKLLEGVGGTAIQAERFLELSATARKELYRDHQVLFVYHDEIDATGDNKKSERRTFEAAESTIRKLVDLVKRLTSANATNIFITADHGFLFQHDELPEAHTLSTKPQGDAIKVTNRRYVLGQGLKRDDAFTTFEPNQVGLSDDLEVQVPKSIHRIKVAGGGSRFVHGGAALQEIVVPVITVSKKRVSTTRRASVQILPETDKITTGQIVVRLFQSEQVTDKIQPQTLRAGIYGDGVLISNQVELVFDSTSDDKRDRYQNARMLLGEKAEAYNNRTVEFRLEERIPNTSEWKVYAKQMYTLRRSFTSDFDF